MAKNKLGVKAILQFLCLCIGGNIIFYVAYMRMSYYDAFMEAFTMTNTEFGVLFSTYALFSVGTFFIGGIITDKFSPKKLLAFSFLSTGLLDLWFGTFPDYKVAVIIYALMGVTTTLTFFAAMIKTTRQFGRLIGEGKALGFLEGGRSIAGAAFATLGLLLFGRFADMVAGLQGVIFMYGISLILLAIITMFVFSDENTADTSTENPFKLAWTCLKNPSVWMMSLIIMGIYATGSGYNLIAPYATSVFAASITMGAVLGIFRDYFQPVGALVGGFFSEKIGISKFILIGCLVLAAVDASFVLIPGQPSMIVLVAIGTAVGFVVLGALRGQYYANMKEARIPMVMSGTTTGLMATIGYTPDIFLSPIFGSFLDKYPDVVAYKYIFLTLAGFAIFSAVMTIIFRRVNKENIRLNKEEALAAKNAVKLDGTEVKMS
ncbi:putative ATP synthase F0, A subunit [Desulfitobacterium hafniense DP7]|uniref:Putative ATP synthase F0, A subunit n=1 Tax=Desulfitobacterium hafniense DP7 TaxID=537010 RepID=G9XGQ8_DESHA|nr:MFS transporter [Desulfitobacterium hafniense]EHL09093.1 putative ATP synthase F0, A subunit [Desulfitobacterium hafniense DP7]